MIARLTDKGHLLQMSPETGTGGLEIEGREFQCRPGGGHKTQGLKSRHEYGMRALRLKAERLKFEAGTPIN